MKERNRSLDRQEGLFHHPDSQSGDCIPLFIQHLLDTKCMTGCRDPEKHRTLSHLLGFSRGKHSLTDIQTDQQVRGRGTVCGDTYCLGTGKHEEGMWAEMGRSSRQRAQRVQRLQRRESSGFLRCRGKKGNDRVEPGKVSLGTKREYLGCHVGKILSCR